MQKLYFFSLRCDDLVVERDSKAYPFSFSCFHQCDTRIRVGRSQGAKKRYAGVVTIAYKHRLTKGTSLSTHVARHSTPATNASYRVPIPPAALIAGRLQPKARVFLNRCLKESVKPPQGVSPLLGSFHPHFGLRLGKYSV